MNELASRKRFTITAEIQESMFSVTYVTFTYMYTPHIASWQRYWAECTLIRTRWYTKSWNTHLRLSHWPRLSGWPTLKLWESNMCWNRADLFPVRTRLQKRQVREKWTSSLSFCWTCSTASYRNWIIVKIEEYFLSSVTKSTKGVAAWGEGRGRAGAECLTQWEALGGLCGSYFCI